MATVTAIATAVWAVVSALLQNVGFVLLLVGLALGFHFGDQFGCWRQSIADKGLIHHNQPDDPNHRVRPIRDFIHFIFGETPEEQQE